MRYIHHLPAKLSGGKQTTPVNGLDISSLLRIIELLPTAYVVREEVMFSLCPPLRGGTYLPGGGGYLPSQVWIGGYLPWWGGGVPTLTRVGGVPTLAGVEGGTYLPRSGWGGYLPG